MKNRIEQRTAAERGRLRKPRAARAPGRQALVPLYPLATMVLLAATAGCSADSGGDGTDGPTSPRHHSPGLAGGIGPDYDVVGPEPDVADPVDGWGGAGGAGGVQRELPPDVVEAHALAHGPDCDCQFLVR